MNPLFSSQNGTLSKLHVSVPCAARHFVTEDYLSLMRSTRLWFDPPRPGDAELALMVPSDMPLIRGSVGHEGGLWVHPEHRKRGLSVIMPHLARALCFRQWTVDWQTGVTLRGIGACGIAKWACGAPHVVPCFEGNTPLKPYPERLYVVYMSRQELLAGLDLDAVAALLAHNDHRARGPSCSPWGSSATILSGVSRGPNSKRLAHHKHDS